MFGSLEGYRTYISAALIGVATILKVLDIIDENTFQAFMALLAALGLAALRAGVQSASKPCDK